MFPTSPPTCLASGENIARTGALDPVVEVAQKEGPVEPVSERRTLRRRRRRRLRAAPPRGGDVA
eukprot:COSAG01_NODE_7178_length_3317_cov_3.132070_1_plen_63_part_10